MIHALKMFAVNTFGDIGLISRRVLHQIGNGDFTSQRSRIPITATLIQGQSSYKCESRIQEVTSVPNYAQIGVDQEDTWVGHLYLTPSFDCL